MASLPQRAPRTLVAIGAAKTDVGRRREHNEDQVLVADEIGVYGVADGMGGHQAGDVASSVAAASIEEFFWSDREIDLEIEGMDELVEGGRRIMASVHFANEQVFARSGKSANQGGMGSTVVVIYVSLDEQQVHICHVGDSRCYRIRDEEIELLTEDHSMINEALRLNPDLSEEILRQLPTNVVTRALGTKESVRPDVRTEELVEGDIYLMCSDGLTGEITDEEILATVLEVGGDLELGSELLVDLANQHGGRDNVSAVLVRIEDAESLTIDDEDSGSSLVVVEDEEEAAATTRDEETDVITSAEIEAADLAWEDDEEIDVDLDAPETTDEGIPRRDSLTEVRDPRVFEDAILFVKDLHPEPDDGSVVVMPVFGLGRMTPLPAEPRGRNCPECRHVLLPDEVFCGMCGTDVSDTAVLDDPDLAHCDACGSMVYDGTAYCVECGVLHGY